MTRGKLVAACLACLPACPLLAQSGASPFLTIPVDARSSGMGGTGVALARGSFIAFHNPAALPFATGRGGAGDSHTPWLPAWLPGAFLNAAGGYYRLDERHGVAAGFRYFSLPGGPGRDDRATPSRALHPAEWAAEAAYARRLSANAGASLAARYTRSDMGERAAGAATFDAKLFYRAAFHPLAGATWAAGLGLNNVGGKIKYAGKAYALPAWVTLGGALSLPFSPRHELHGAVDLAYHFLPAGEPLLETAIGAEYLFLSRGSLRAGYHAGNGGKEKNRATLGCGLHVAPASCHFAYWITSPSSPLRNTWSLSVEVTL
ncbi:MAG: PorV/PorQ family protein [Odoribacteraceae bacterium]|jgi:hypothetical protein|nr:PorV/PorQ family protein [Odoribacteraceae bacterium]